MSLSRIMLSHFKCRNNDYPCKYRKVKRFPVPDNHVSWDVEWLHYDPQYFSCDSLIGKEWADPEISDPNFHPSWNTLDGSVNRCSYHGPYQVVNSFPQNPVGRTGLSGRGILGKWGPNHAADPIVTKWKRDENNLIKYHENSKKPILQFIGINRRDCCEWAIPGGMVDPGEVISQTLRREFMEEALNYLEMEAHEKVLITQRLSDFFQRGIDIYKGYVDDGRNTDNAWIETVAQNFHDEPGILLDKICLSAGDDAKDVSWIDISRSLHLYASHSELIKLVGTYHNAHW